VIAAQVPTLFNSEGATATFDLRSDNKGPEPEAITIGDVGGRRFAFIGLERIGGAFVYDITNPTQPVRLGYSSAQGATFHRKAWCTSIRRRAQINAHYC